MVTPIWLRVVVTLLCAAQIALANTEQIRFRLTGREAQGAGIPIRQDQKLTHSATPSNYNDTFTEWFKVVGAEPGLYELRVCWPASHPASFDLQYDEQNGGVVGVTYSSDYYSHIPSIMETPIPVPYHVIVNKVLFEALPVDIVSTIGCIVVGLLFAYKLSGLVTKIIA